MTTKKKTTLELMQAAYNVADLAKAIARQWQEKREVRSEIVRHALWVAGVHEVKIHTIEEHTGNQLRAIVSDGGEQRVVYVELHTRRLMGTHEMIYS